MDQEEKIETLIDKFGYNYKTAKCYVDSKGICAYCQQNIFETEAGYGSGEIDHILPQKKYKQLVDEQSNLVYSCYSCNSSPMKGTFDPLDSLSKRESEILDPLVTINTRRDALINEVRMYLKDKLKIRTITYSKIRLLIQDD